MTIQQKDFYATKAKVGAFSFSPKDCDLPPATDVALTSAMVKGSGPQGPQGSPRQARRQARPGDRALGQGDRGPQGVGVRRSCG